MTILTEITALLFAILAVWWLSGYDPKAKGENKKEDLVRRGIRCGITLFLAGIFLWLPASPAIMPILLVVSIAFFLIWRDCLTELFVRGFQNLIDPEDKREFDPGKNLRDLDTIASLIKNGRKEEALQLCQMLKESGDVSVLALETMLEHLGVRQENVQKPRPLVEAYRLRSQGRFKEAELILNSLLEGNPADLDAAMMLMRLYAQDMRRPDRAAETLRSLEKQPYVSPSHVEFARRSIIEWSQNKPRLEKAAVPPESIDELLAHGYLGTVIEILERKTKEQPQDFDSWVKLAEAHGKYCGNFQRAEKIARQIEFSRDFSPEEIQHVKNKLGEWREARSNRD
jgi:hypothetical protein